MNKLKPYFPYLIPIFVFLGVSFALFPDAFQGKVVEQPDMIQSIGKNNEVHEFRDKTGENSLWNNAIFSGMPAFYAGTEFNGNLLRHLHNYGFTLGLPVIIGLFFLTMLAGYILFLSFRINPWLSMLGALAIG